MAGSSQDMAEGTPGCKLNTMQVCTISFVLQPLHTISPCCLCSHTVNEIRELQAEELTEFPQKSYAAL